MVDTTLLRSVTSRLVLEVPVSFSQILLVVLPRMSRCSTSRILEPSLEVAQTKVRTPSRWVGIRTNAG